jgi:F-type H+-transporting ATPase subunit delta
MKIKAQQYAAALFESLEGANKDKTDKTVAKFARILIAMNQTSQLEDVIGRFSSIWNRKKDIIEAEVITPVETDESGKQLFKKLLIERSGKKDLEISWKRDKSLLGGAILKFDSKIIDASLKSKLRELRQKMMQD